MTGDAQASDDRVVTPHHEPPPEATASMRWAPAGRDALDVAVTAGWTVLRRKESPAAEVFTVSYTVDGGDDGRSRPVTFVFNGGPGASAAFLHVGLVGPRRVDLPADGSAARMPVRLVDNESSWLPLSDLVLIDPVGTGLSRLIPPAERRRAKEERGRGRWFDGSQEAGVRTGDGYYRIGTDLAAMREIIGRWLSANRRWDAPVFLAGESYGGYRVGRLARSLHSDEGVGLAGAVLISPALELTPLSDTDYSIEAFIDRLPVMAAAAFHHGRSRIGAASTDDAVAAAVDFAAGPYVSFLVRGASMPEDEREAVFDRLGDLTGLDPAVIRRVGGRVSMHVFSHELLRDQGLVTGRYDATVTAVDPFPDRQPSAGPDPTLDGTTPAFTAGVNQLLRAEVGLETERRYELLSLDVNESWQPDDDAHALDVPAGASDDLRYGMALNPHLRVMIAHGHHDLVTSPQSSARIVDQMRLEADTASRLVLRRYDGGHMFYTWATSREAFAADIADFYAACLPPA